MSSTAYDDQFVTITTGGGGGSGGAGKNYYTGHGATGSYTVPSGTFGITSPSMYGTLSAGSSYASTVSMSTSILSIMAEGDGDAMIKTKKNTINLDEMAVMMDTIKERLLILTPNFEQHEKYPILKDLYEQYKVVEAMLKEEDKK
jgi:hypothetical protein